MLLAVIVMGVLGAVFTIRDWWWLYVLGIWLYMSLVPIIESAEQTVIQKVVPFQTQGRVFGAAATFEAGAAPITAFLIAPIAQFWVIPYMETDAGRGAWGWLLGEGQGRGIALVFLVSGLVMVVLAALALTTRSYRILSREYTEAPAGMATLTVTVTASPPSDPRRPLRRAPVTPDSGEPARGQAASIWTTVSLIAAASASHSPVNRSASTVSRPASARTRKITDAARTSRASSRASFANPCAIARAQASSAALTAA
jgi:DHA3 family multidrug efflux protein-like MFS transporter